MFEKLISYDYGMKSSEKADLEKPPEIDASFNSDENTNGHTKYGVINQAITPGYAVETPHAGQKEASSPQDGQASASFLHHLSSIVEETEKKCSTNAFKLFANDLKQIATNNKNRHL